MWVILWGEGKTLARLRRGMIEALFLQAAGVGLLALMQILLGRRLGAHEYGVLSFTLAWTNVLAVVASLGWPTALTRFIAQYIEQKKWGLLRGVIQCALQSTLLVGILVGIIEGIASFWPGIPPGVIQGLRYAVILIPLYALIRLRSGAFQGLARIRASLTLEQMLLPALVISGVLLGIASSAFRASIVYMFSAGIVVAVGGFWLWRLVPAEGRQAQPEFQTRYWISVSVPLVFGSLSLIVMTKVDVLMLGYLSTPETTGLYSAASRMALLNSFVLMAANTIAAPMISAAYHGDHPDQLGVIVRKVTLWATLGSLPLFLFMMIWPQFLLGLFGSDYVRGALVLRILAIGEFINAITGPVGFTLVMTGRERIYAWITGVLMILVILGDILVIPRWGAVGAAIVSATGEAARNLLMLWQVRRHYRIKPAG